MKTRLVLTVKYKNGNVWKELVNFLHSDGKCLRYTVDKQVYSVAPGIVRIPFENIDTFDLEIIECDGWKY